MNSNRTWIQIDLVIWLDMRLQWLMTKGLTKRIYIYTVKHKTKPIFEIGL